jgi:hypothetical protein
MRSWGATRGLTRGEARRLSFILNRCAAAIATGTSAERLKPAARDEAPAPARGFTFERVDEVRLRGGVETGQLAARFLERPNGPANETHCDTDP